MQEGTPPPPGSSGRTDRWLNILGVAATVLFGIAALAIGLIPLIRVPKPALTYRIVGMSNAFDVYKYRSEVEILFRGQRVNPEEHNLQIVSFFVHNSGDIDITQSMYDASDIWGFSVKNGSVIDVKITDSDSAYILDHLNPRIISDDLVSFDKIILPRVA